MRAAAGHQLEITSTRRDAIARELKTPPFSRIASGRPAALCVWRKPASCRVTAGSCAYGSPNSCSATRVVRRGNSSGPHVREKTVENDSFDIFTRKLRGHRTADEAAAFGDDGEMVGLRRVRREQRFLRGAAGLHEFAPLRRTEFASAGRHLFFGFARDCRIHVVAAEHQMIADRNAAQAFAFADLDQREVGSAAADIHHQHQRHAFESRREIVAMTRGEIVKGSLWFFDQRELLKTGAARGRHGKRARDFVKRCGDRDDDFESFEWSVGMRMIPCVANMEKQP